MCDVYVVTGMFYCSKRFFYVSCNFILYTATCPGRDTLGQLFTFLPLGTG